MAVTIPILLLAACDSSPTDESESGAIPELAIPDRFRVELYADLAAYPFNWTFHLTLTSGENGFPAGLYVTGGPSFQGDSELRRLFRVDGPSQVNVVEDGFQVGIESMVFARGAYGDGMLLTLPQATEIHRLLADGTLTTFASVGTAPFGPTVLAYTPDDQLYVTDFTGGNILRVEPDGSNEIFASLPLAASAVLDISGAKALLADTSGRYGRGLISATFSAAFDDPQLHGLDAIYAVSSDGSEVTQLATGLTGIEFLTLGPGGAFGTNLFVAVHGSDLNGDGGVYTLSADGRLTPFMTGIDAMHVVFDTEGVLGGGMFVADLYNPLGAPENSASKIWRVVPTP